MAKLHVRTHQPSVRESTYHLISQRFDEHDTTLYRACSSTYAIALRRSQHYLANKPFLFSGRMDHGWIQPSIQPLKNEAFTDTCLVSCFSLCKPFSLLRSRQWTGLNHTVGTGMWVHLLSFFGFGWEGRGAERRGEQRRGAVFRGSFQPSTYV